MAEKSLTDKVLERVDLIAMINEVTPLKQSIRKNTEYSGRCPFHDDSSPSFTASTTGAFICRGCGKAGNAIHFHAEINKMEYREALIDLARKFDVIQKPGKNVLDDQSELINKMVEKYHANLLHSKAALEYVKERGFSDEMIRELKIGFAYGNEFAGLSKAAITTAVQAGLIWDDKESKPVFARRIMFPIFDMRSRPIGFAGRVLSENAWGAKYLNSPESDLFLKSDNLYGLNMAQEHIRKKRVAVVVEGYMDVGILKQYDINNACAVMGTSASPKMFEALWKMADKIVFCLDGDKPGRKATFRNILSAAPTMTDGKELCVASLPDGYDPDEFVREHGAASFEARCDAAESFCSFAVRDILGENKITTPEKRATYLMHINNFAAAFVNAPLLQEQIVAEANAICLTETIRSALSEGRVSQDEWAAVAKMATIMNAAKGHQLGAGIKQVNASSAQDTTAKCEPQGQRALHRKKLV